MTYSLAGAAQTWKNANADDGRATVFVSSNLRTILYETHVVSTVRFKCVIGASFVPRVHREEENVIGHRDAVSPLLLQRPRVSVHMVLHARVNLSSAFVYYTRARFDLSIMCSERMLYLYVFETAVVFKCRLFIDFLEQLESGTFFSTTVVRVLNTTIIIKRCDMIREK